MWNLQHIFLYGDKILGEFYICISAPLIKRNPWAEEEDDFIELVAQWYVYLPNDTPLQLFPCGFFNFRHNSYSIEHLVIASFWF